MPTTTSEPAELEPSNEPLGPSVAGSTVPARKSSLYTIVWRWHFYAGLIVMPVLFFLAITGALYTLKGELSLWKDRDLLVVTPEAERVSFEKLRQTAYASSPSKELEGMAFFARPDRSVRFIFHAAEAAHHDGEHDDRHELIYLNPYSGEVLGTRIAEEDFFAIVLELHRSLMLGVPGRIISELVTGWGLILIATGVYLWWPRGKRNVGVWIPRIRGKWYAVLRDWHTVPAAYLSPLLFLVLLTGMFFSYASGSAFNSTVKAAGHWPKNWFGPASSRPVDEGTRPASLDQIVVTLQSRARPDDQVSFRFPTNPTQGYRAFFMRDEDKNSLKMVAVDQYTAEVLEEVDSTQVPFLYKVRLWAVSIHMGQIFGTPTKILALVISLAVCGLAITGTWMWWERRPHGRTGFPRRPEPRSLPLWGWGIVLLTALLLPITGITILMVTLVDRISSKLRRPGTA